MAHLKQEKERSAFVYFAATSVNFLSFASAVGFAWPSPFVPKLNGKVDPELNPLSAPTTILEDSWIVSLQLIGALTGPLFAGTISKWIGKKNTLLLFNLPVIASNAIMIFANRVMHFYIARFLIGMGAGCVWSFVPIYVAEISTVSNRSVTSMLISLMMTISMLVTYIIGPYVTIRTFAIIAMVPSLIFVVTFGLFVPESPYQLVQQRKMRDAEKALMKLRRKKDVTKELDEISKSIENSQSNMSVWKLMKMKHIKKCRQIAVGLMFFQQCSGYLPITFYQQTIFDSTNGPIKGNLSVMLVGFIQVVTTVLVTFVVKVVGRKKLMIISFFGVFASLNFLAFYFFFQNLGYNLSSLSWLPVLAICMYNFWFNVGTGPISWTIISEIFPANAKSFLSTLTVVVLLCFAFVVSFIFPILSLYLGMAGLFWVFSGCVVGGIIFSNYVLIETKDKSFDEIQLMLGNEVALQPEQVKLNQEVEEVNSDLVPAKQSEDSTSAPWKVYIN